MNADRTDDKTNLIRAWITYNKRAMEKARASNQMQREQVDEDEWASQELDDLAYRDPTEALKLIADILDTCADDDIRSCLAAGPLESLLVQHGARIIGEVEAVASSRKGFADLFSGVWSHSIDPAVWKRIEILRAKNAKGRAK